MENQKLRETLDEYHVEFKEVKNQGMYIFSVWKTGIETVKSVVIFMLN